MLRIKENNHFLIKKMATVAERKSTVSAVLQELVDDVSVGFVVPPVHHVSRPVLEDA